MYLINEYFQLIHDLMTDGFIGVIMAIILCVPTLLIICPILGFLFKALDSWFMPPQSDYGIVVKKDYTPFHQKKEIVFSEIEGKHYLAIYPPEPARYCLVINVNGKKDFIYVNERFFKSVTEDQRINTEFVLGRLSHSLYLKSIRIV